MTQHIVLVGGGYVSIWAYRQLVKKAGRQIKSGEITVTVVSPEKHHVFHGWTGEAITGTIRFNSRLSPLKELMPLATHINGYVTAVHSDINCITVALPGGSRERVPYTQLVLGMGTSDNTRIAGSSEYALRVKNLTDLERTICCMEQMLLQSKEPAGLRKHLVIVGAGFTGVEIATNLSEYLQKKGKELGIAQNQLPAITLVNSRENILPQISGRYKKMMAYAHKVIDQFGITVVHNKKVSRFDALGLHLDDGSFLPADHCISTVGQSQVNIAGTAHMMRDDTNRLVTDAQLRIVNHPNIWGGGDACSVPHFYKKQACPANALWAIKHGELIGKNLAHIATSKAPKTFTYKGLGQAASLGMGKGICELYGLQFTGVIAWIMRWFFFMFFMPLHQTRMEALKDWLVAFGVSSTKKPEELKWHQHQLNREALGVAS